MRVRFRRFNQGILWALNIDIIEQKRSYSLKNYNRIFYDIFYVFPQFLAMSWYAEELSGVKESETVKTLY